MSMDPKLALHGFAAAQGAALASGQLTPPGAPPWLQLVIQLAGMFLSAWAAHTYDPDHMSLAALRALPPPPQPPPAASIVAPLPEANPTTPAQPAKT